MSNPPSRLAVFAANAAWFLSCLPGLLKFLAATFHVRRAQLRLLGPRPGFDSAPLTEYEDWRDAMDAICETGSSPLLNEPVLRLLPTSGSTGAGKLIPYTRTLLRQFKQATDPWIAGLYLLRPGLFHGRHYWSLSPSTRVPDPRPSAVPIGFGDDADYLSSFQRRMARRLFVVPFEITQVQDAAAFEYLTLLFMLRERNLRLISVWHPSFLTILLDRLAHEHAALIESIRAGRIPALLDIPAPLRAALEKQLAPDRKRADELARVRWDDPAFPLQVWPRMQIISCWTEGHSAPWVERLATLFPSALIQGKGLTATEGIVSVPLGRAGRRVCAVRSHYFEFIEPGSDRTRRAWELEHGRSYSVVLTCGNGLTRYRLHDTVTVTGFFGQAPCFAFTGRDNAVSDLVGEKVHLTHVEEALRAAEHRYGMLFRFAMVAPLKKPAECCYVLYVQAPECTMPDWAEMAGFVENELSRNYHYLHARRQSQLQPLRIFVVKGEAFLAYRAHLLARGASAGDIKQLALCSGDGWDSAFEGTFADARPNVQDVDTSQPHGHRAG
jgi:hypothetical protein